jgi:rhodanese-related sulfurtransferase
MNKQTMKIATFLFGLVAMASLAVAAEPTGITEITQSDLQAAIQAKTVTLLDANASDTFNSGHIPGAISFRAHQQDLAKVLPADKSALIVAYCRDVNCAAYRQAAYAAQDLGYTNIKHFVPGIKGWIDSGAPTEKGTQ